MSSEITLLQINLYHSKGASSILVRSMAVIRTKPEQIVRIKESWLVRGKLRGLALVGEFTTPMRRKNLTSTNLHLRECSRGFSTNRVL